MSGKHGNVIVNYLQIFFLGATGHSPCPSCLRSRGDVGGVGGHSPCPSCSRGDVGGAGGLSSPLTYTILPYCSALLRDCISCCEYCAATAEFFALTFSDIKIRRVMLNAICIGTGKNIWGPSKNPLQMSLHIVLDVIKSIACYIVHLGEDKVTLGISIIYLDIGPSIIIADTRTLETRHLDIRFGIWM